MAGIGPSSPELDETASPTTKRQTGSTERKSRTRRAHLWPNLSRGSERWRLGLPHAVTSLSSTTAASRGRDGCGEVWHPCLYSPKALRVRKGEDWARDLASAKKESDADDGLRKGATLTSGPAVSATERERKARACLLAGQAACWARPRPKAGEGRAAARERAGRNGGLRLG
jgi:hypothetical protein